jgi:hypothetical protein
MKKITSSLLCLLLLLATILPFTIVASAAETNASVKSTADFKDLKDLPKDLKDKLDVLIAEGVFSGVTEDSFDLVSPMDRAQFAKVASIIFALSIDKTLTTSSFTDVGSNHWALQYVEALKKAGLTNGYDAEGKMYNPSGAVSRQELATFLIRGLGLDEAAKKAAPVTDTTVDEWARGYVALALEKGIMTNQDNGTFGGTVSATRQMLALASFASKKLFAEANKPGQPVPPVTQPTNPTKPEPQPGGTSAKGKRVVITSDMETGKPELRSDEIAVVNRLKSLGFEVTRLSSTKLEVEAVKDYDLVIVGWSTNSKYVKKKLRELTIPVVYNKSISFGDADFSTVAEKTDVMKQTEVTIVDSAHPIAAGLKGDVQLHYDPVAVSYGMPGGDGKIIASVKNDPTKGFIISYEKGSKDVVGGTVNARTALLGFTAKTMMDNATDEAWKLFDATILWAIQTP